MYGDSYIVSDVMTHTVAAVGRHTPFEEIVRLMQERQVSALPVVQGEGRVVGVVCEADLLLRRPVGLAKADALAEDLMSSPAVTVRADATLAEAAHTMARQRVKRLPVVDEAGLLRGIVSGADLLKVFLRADDDIAEEVRREIVSYLFPPPDSAIQLEVHDGVVTLTGRIRDTALVPVAALLARAVAGVVDVRFDLARDDHGVSGAGRPYSVRRRWMDDQLRGQLAACPSLGNERSS
ncbi:CBS domain-containing protein [Streptomyces sp. CG1]|uniref:CBS domain-containing protein n=1 Tax=Streptomyces sp. CG1 TaxID=1287523 RepID=UPI0034E1E2B1